MAGSGHGHRMRIRPAGLSLHPLGPADEIAIPNQKAQRRTQGEAEANTGEDFSGVLFDLHPAAPTVALLPARQIAIDGLRLELQPGREALQDSGQGRAMAFTGGQITKAAHRAPPARNAWGSPAPLTRAAPTHH